MRADVGHGGWLPLLDRIGVSSSAAHRYMVAAERFANFPSLGNLPPSATALYELSRLAPEAIESGIERGDIQGTLARLVWHYLPFTPERSDSLQVLSARQQMRMELMWEAFHAFVEKMRELLHAFADGGRSAARTSEVSGADGGGQRSGGGGDTPATRRGLAPRHAGMLGAFRAHPARP